MCTSSSSILKILTLPNIREQLPDAPLPLTPAQLTQAIDADLTRKSLKDTWMVRIWSHEPSPEESTSFLTHEVQIYSHKDTIYYKIKLSNGDIQTQAIPPEQQSRALLNRDFRNALTKNSTTKTINSVDNQYHQEIFNILSFADKNGHLFPPLTAFDGTKVYRFSIQEYLNDRLLKFLNLSIPSIILMTEFIDRWAEKHTLHSYRTHRLVLTSLLLAHKYMDDVPHKTIPFGVTGGIPAPNKDSKNQEEGEMERMERYLANELKHEIFPKKAYQEQLDYYTNVFLSLDEKPALPPTLPPPKKTGLSYSAPDARAPQMQRNPVDADPISDYFIEKTLPDADPLRDTDELDASTLPLPLPPSLALEEKSLPKLEPQTFFMQQPPQNLPKEKCDSACCLIS